MEYHDITLRKVDMDLVGQIVRERKLDGLDENKVRHILRQGVITVKAFADLCGREFTTVSRLCDRKIDAQNNPVAGKLDLAISLPSADDTGPRLILNNDKAISYLRSTLNNG